MKLGGIGVAAVLLGGCAIWLWPATETVSGPARAIDGDTLIVDGKRIRLAGIDAPERRQHCSGTYYCGIAAWQTLSDAVADKTITCKIIDRDRYDRRVGRCAVADGPQDLSEFMAYSGWAISYPQYDSAGHYAKFQEVARKERRGLWAGDFQEPWAWRQEHKR